MKEVGDYNWCQISMWDFSPKNCIETYINSECGKHVFHFYLEQITEVINENHWKNKVVESVNGVPDDILNWRNGQVKIKTDGKAVNLT